MAKGVVVKLDKRRLLELERQMPGAADQAVGKMANDFVADVDDHWSRTSPSSPGQPPAVDTGLLKNSVVARRVRPGHWRVTYGTKYAVHLEYGTLYMAARPFVAPALLRMAKRAKGYFKAIFK